MNIFLPTVGGTTVGDGATRGKTKRKYDIQSYVYIMNYKKYITRSPLRERMIRYEIDMIYKKDYKNLKKYMERYGVSEDTLVNFIQASLKYKIYPLIRALPDVSSTYREAVHSNNLLWVAYIARGEKYKHIRYLSPNPSQIALSLLKEMEKKRKKCIQDNTYYPYIKYLHDSGQRIRIENTAYWNYLYYTRKIPVIPNLYYTKKIPVTTIH